MTRISALLLAVLAAAWLRSNAPTSPPAAAQPVTPVGVKDVVKASNQFGFDLCARLRQQHKGNLSISPFSLMTGLAMVYNGAQGQTLAEMAHVLHLPPRPEGAEPGLKELLAGVASPPAEGREGYQLVLANRLWGQRGYAFSPAFLKTTADVFHARLGLVDFQAHSEAARREINSWVEETTGDRIRDFLSEDAIDSQTRLVLTNAVDFRALWEEPFPEKFTRTAPFHLTRDKQVRVPMMSQLAEFGYAATDGVRILELPYKGGEASMLVLLPDAVDGLEGLEKQLSAARLESWRKLLQTEEVTVFLPRFTVKANLNLSQALVALGMRQAFSDRADFSGMTNQSDLKLSEVAHAAVVIVNEAGTEASAATGSIMPGRMLPVTFRADHPFLFVIVHKRTGAVLFMGRVVQPGE
jgi:serpin B